MSKNKFIYIYKIKSKFQIIINKLILTILIFLIINKFLFNIF